MARSANAQLGGATERQNIKKILKNAKLLHDGFHGSRYTLRSERKGAASRACSERNITCENIFVENFAISKQRHSQKTIWGDEFATLSTYYGYFRRVWFNNHRPGLQQDLNLLWESSISFSSQS